ncbi:MAG: hypothetical protein H7644_06350 [Candidatus Heimdallarchaeota archaeon]|nr:hypothetical protein [Candidatus Heimdallarchaeota archaeon]MCK5143368.1 hypothetical protein [Candidatus Heimdallarchaeota archaeon]
MKSRLYLSGLIKKVLSPLYKPLLFVYSIPAAQKLGILTILLGIASITCFIGAIVVDGLIIFTWIIATIACSSAMIITSIIWQIIRNRSKS